MAYRLVTVEVFISDDEWDAVERSVAETLQRNPGYEWGTQTLLQSLLMDRLFDLKDKQRRDDEHRTWQERAALQAYDEIMHEPEPIPEWLNEIRQHVEEAKALPAHAAYL